MERLLFPIHRNRLSCVIIRGRRWAQKVKRRIRRKIVIGRRFWCQKPNPPRLPRLPQLPPNSNFPKTILTSIMLFYDCWGMCDESRDTSIDFLLYISSNKGASREQRGLRAIPLQLELRARALQLVLREELLDYGRGLWTQLTWFCSNKVSEKTDSWCTNVRRHRRLHRRRNRRRQKQTSAV